MSSETYTAICLNAIDYKENDKLLTLYAKGKGKITATLRGCKSPKSKLKFAGSPLCFGEYEFNLTRGRYIVTGVSDAEIFTNLWADFDKFYIAMSMLEVFNKFTLEDEIYDDLFLELLRSLNALSDSSYVPSQVLTYYLYHFTIIAGYEPCLDSCIKCGNENITNAKFSVSGGGLICPECGNGLALNIEVLQILLDLQEFELAQYLNKKYSQKNILNVVFVFSKYLEHILGEKVKSLCQFLDNVIKNT